MKTIFNFFILLVFLGSCQEEEVEINSIHKENKEWGEFSVGSYWIYQNDSTQETDSLYVVEFSNGQAVDLSREFEYSLTKISEDELVSNEFNHSEICLSLNEIFIYDFCVKPLTSSHFKLINTDNRLEIETLSHDFLAEFKQLENVVINNNDYSEVLYIKLRPDNWGYVDWYSDANDYMEYWIAKNRWIIKKVFTLDNSCYSWSLKEYVIK